MEDIDVDSDTNARSAQRELRSLSRSVRSLTDDVAMLRRENERLKTRIDLQEEFIDKLQRTVATLQQANSAVVVASPGQQSRPPSTYTSPFGATSSAPPGGLLPGVEQFRCDVCDVDISGALNWQQHLAGRQHLSKEMRKRSRTDY